jgi:hypothetical protein
MALLKQLHVITSLLYYITIHVFASMALPHYIYFIKCALDFSKVRIKLSSTQSKASRMYLIITSHRIASYLHYKATIMPIAIHSQQVPLIGMLTQQGSLAVAKVVLSFLLSLLIYAIEREKQ